jgi:hypothetical protein
MLILIVTTFIIILLFIIILMYKLSDNNWADQFMSNNFTDKDFFTKIIKFLMKK